MPKISIILFTIILGGCTYKPCMPNYEEVSSKIESPEIMFILEAECNRKKAEALLTKPSN